MLPFLKPKVRNAGVITEVRKSDNKESNDSDGLESCGQDLITAIESGDAKRVAKALRAAYEICDSEPHEDSEQTEPHSYDAQNEE